MPICVVQGCHYRRGQKSRKQLKFERETGQMVTLHRFPKDPNRRNVWKDALMGWVTKSTENSFICSVHFTDDCWEQSSVNRRLKNDALPTLFPSLTEADQANICYVARQPQNSNLPPFPDIQQKRGQRRSPTTAGNSSAPRVARKRRRSQPPLNAQIKQEPELMLEPDAPPADEHGPEPPHQEPEVLLTELHRAEPVIPSYVPTQDHMHHLAHAAHVQAMYDAYPAPPPAHHY